SRCGGASNNSSASARPLRATAGRHRRDPDCAEPPGEGCVEEATFERYIASVAQVVELVDAGDSKSPELRLLRVRVPPWASARLLDLVGVSSPTLSSGRLLFRLGGLTRQGGAEARTRMSESE